MTSATLAGVKIEVLQTTTPANATLAAAKGEVLHQGIPKAEIAALKGEILHQGAPKARLVALKAEVMYPVVAAVVAGRRVVSIVMG